MTRRAKTSDKTSGARAGKPANGKRRTAAVAGSRPRAPNADLNALLETRTAELADTRKLLAESLEQQTATSEVLKVISASPGDLQPVFQAMLENALRICDAKFGTLLRFDGEVFHFAAGRGTPTALVEFQSQRRGFLPQPDSPLHRVLQARQLVHCDDETTESVPGRPALLGGARSSLIVPMLKDGELVGALSIFRTEVRPFTKKQIELVQNFAAQAVIAIENTRLLNELRQRTDDLSEALEQQTATSEVLKVISSSPGELEPVFNAMLDNATRICEANFGILFISEGDSFRTGALHNAPPALVEARRQDRLFRPPPHTALGRMVHARQSIQIADMLAEPGYFDAPPGYSKPQIALVHDARTVVAVPMLNDAELVGAIVIYRQEVRPFTDKQIALVSNFAAQAVIAIENTRLLNELRESLEQQTATSEVLQVISSSPGELGSVFNSMLENATRICQAKFGFLFRYDGHGLHTLAQRHASPELAEFYRDREARAAGAGFVPAEGTALRRLLDTKEAVNTVDQINAPNPSPSARLGGARSHLAVPLLKDDQLIGAMAIFRTEVQPFTSKQIELVQNFAAQAVIAIENTRLLNELRESLQQQTATADVLKVISRSTFDLKGVLNTLIESAVRLCEADMAAISRPAGDVFEHLVSYGYSPEHSAFMQTHPIPSGRGSASGRVVLEGKPVHIHDIRADADYTLADRAKFDVRTMLGVPLMREGVAIGVIILQRKTVRPFTENQIELVTTFADQAVIAIENTRLLNELRESLQQQTATADVLKVISNSPGDLQPVFQAMLSNATRICGARFGVLFRLQNGEIEPGALHNVPTSLERHLSGRGRIKIRPGSTMERAIQSKGAIHVVDVRQDIDAANNPAAKYAGARTLLTVPMLKDDESIGFFNIYRDEVRPFTEKHIELVRNFASQAVIAVENTRLLNELRQRTDDLSEALKQQTATSEVLQVISSSPGKLEPVFDAMLTNAVQICGAKFGVMSLREKEAFRVVAIHKAPPEFVAARRREPLGRLTPGHNLERLLRTKDIVHVPDITLDPEVAPTLAKHGGAKALLNVPLLKDNALVGSMVIFRQETGPFGDKQIELVKNFAAQAVIAIENARLLNELRESLEQQTATSEVLQVISSSPGNLEPVFESILRNATDICEAKFATLFRCDDEKVYPAAHIGTPPALVEAHRERGAFKPWPGTTLYKVSQSRNAVQTEDDAAMPEPGHHVRFGGARSTVGVPMLKDDQLIGIIVIYRQEVRAFTDKQIALVSNFAAQAVIAIENARLLNELRESLQQQTATADVLKVISRSTFDLQPVLDTLTESAARLCEANMAQVLRPRDEGFYSAASYGHTPEFKERVKALTFAAGRGSVTGRVLTEGKAVQVEDVLADPEYTLGDLSKVAGFRTHLGVPLLREGNPIGVILLSRTVVKPFDAKQIELVQTFADQAVIAIENTRLFDEIQDKSRQLAEASQHKSQFLANMSHELRTPLNAILGYTELISDGVYGTAPEKMQAVLKRVESNGRHLLGLINAVLDLSKIEAGQLVLELAEYSLGDVTQTVYGAVEALAIDKKLAFKADVAPNLPRGRGDERRLAQVLLNLVGNAIKFTDAGEVVISADANNGAFNVSVRDTGPGISAADQAKLFQEFQQADNSLTKKKGGTGLGLAISKRIIEMHGGRIWVESQLGEGSTFFVTIPVEAAAPAKSAPH
jgi:GAF domain-containing protein